MGADQIRSVLAAARAENRAALFPYLVAGLPSPGESVAMFEAMADAGADGFEVGIPYSDPLMDGPTIQEAARRALLAGTSLDVGLELVERIVTATEKPTLVMTYVNPVLRLGPGAFAERAAAAGASGVIVADLPVDEAAPIREAVEANGLGLVLFAAPTTGEDRLRRVAEADPVFIYGVADLGVTGERAERSDRVDELVAAVRAVTDLPIVLGVGISTPDQASSAADVADGVIVGSALVRRVLEAETADDAARALTEAVTAFRAAMERSR